MSEDTEREYADNRESAEVLGWSPELWSMPADEYGDELTEQVKAFQLAEGIEASGIVDAVTYNRLLQWLAGWFWEDPDPAEVADPPAMTDNLLIDGKLCPIDWPRVVTAGEEGAFVVERTYEKKNGKTGTRFKNRTGGLDSICRVGVHWTGTRSIQHSWRASWSQKRSVSTHLEIDWDGTIYQLIDLAKRAYHYGIGWFNDTSIGVDLTNPVALNKTAEANKQLVKLGQPKRPVLSGFYFKRWNPGMFLGATDAQREALRALMKALHVHLGIPMTAPLDDPEHPERIVPVKGYKGAIKRGTKANKALMPPGWYHHCQGRSNRWDHLGLYLTGELQLAKAV